MSKVSIGQNSNAPAFIIKKSYGEEIGFRGLLAIVGVDYADPDLLESPTTIILDANLSVSLGAGTINSYEWELKNTEDGTSGTGVASGASGEKFTISNALFGDDFEVILTVGTDAGFSAKAHFFYRSDAPGGERIINSITPNLTPGSGFVMAFADDTTSNPIFNAKPGGIATIDQIGISLEGGPYEVYPAAGFDYDFGVEGIHNVQFTVNDSAQGNPMGYYGTAGIQMEYYFV